MRTLDNAQLRSSRKRGADALAPQADSATVSSPLRKSPSTGSLLLSALHDRIESARGYYKQAIVNHKPQNYAKTLKGVMPHLATTFSASRLVDLQLRVQASLSRISLPSFLNSIDSKYPGQCPNTFHTEKKTKLRGTLHMIHMLAFLYLMVSNSISVNITVTSVWGLYVSSFLCHYFDARWNWYLASLFELFDYLMVGVSMVAVFLPVYGSAAWWILCGSLALETGIHYYEKMILRGPYKHSLIKHIPHAIQFIMSMCCLVMLSCSLELKLLVASSYSLNIAGILIYLNKSENPESDYWSSHETTHVFIVLADYVKIYCSYQCLSSVSV